MILLNNFSLLMAPKLKEMDEVVKMIHASTILNQMNGHGHALLVCDTFIIFSFCYSMNKKKESLDHVALIY